MSIHSHHAPESWIINTNSSGWTNIAALAITKHLHSKCNLVSLKA